MFVPESSLHAKLLFVTGSLLFTAPALHGSRSIFSQMNSIRAVLWDMDGTLVDSEELHWLSWRETLATEGVSITHEQFLASFGRRNDSALPAWLGPDATPERVARVSDAKDTLYRDMVRAKGISAMPGVPQWLWQLHNDGWRQAVASSAPRLNVNVVLEILRFTRRFQCIVSGEDVKRGKPDPEVFLTAASRLGASSNRCIVVEDAVPGVEGARCAGMRSIGVNRRKKDLPADIVVESLEALAPDAFEKVLDGSALCCQPSVILTKFRQHNGQT